MLNGKGKLYYENGNIKYEDNFVDDVFDGEAKYYIQKVIYYIQEDIKTERGMAKENYIIKMEKYNMMECL